MKTHYVNILNILLKMFKKKFNHDIIVKGGMYMEINEIVNAYQDLKIRVNDLWRSL